MNSEEVPLEVLGGVFVTREDVEVVAVDLYVAADAQICRGDEFLIFVHIFVLSALEELALHNAAVLLGRLEDGNGVVSQKERYYKSTVEVFRHSSIKFSSEPKYLLVVIHILKEVSLWLVRQQLIHIPKRINLISKPIVRGYNNLLGLSRLRVLNLPNLKVLAKLLF